MALPARGWYRARIRLDGVYGRPLGAGEGEMTERLAVRFEVVYYDLGEGRKIFGPADDRSSVLADKLRECRAAGHSNARLSEVAHGA